MPDVDESTDPRTYSDEEVQALLAERIEAVRKEEKDKLYSSKSNQTDAMNAMKAELAELQKSQRERERDADKARKLAEAEAKKRAEAELSAKDLIAKREAEWEAQHKEFAAQTESKVSALEQRLEQERVIREKEAELATLAQFIQRRVAEEADNIEPHLVKYVSGSTTEEVEQSIAQLKEDSAGIYQSGQEHFRGARAAMPGSAPTGNTPSGPMEMMDQGQQEFTADDIQGMPMAQYLKHREALIRAAGGHASGSGKGLFN